MLATAGNAQRARWAVLWVYKDKKGRSKVARKNFGDDYSSAEDLYFKAKLAGKRAATLACVNMGFPPPMHLRSHTVRKKGRSRTTGRVKVVVVEVNPLRELNLQGKVWCPYCRRLRPFVMRKTFELNGIRVSDPRWVCPICDISHRDHNVRVWNPTAALHMESTVATRRRAPRKETKPRRRRRR